MTCRKLCGGLCRAVLLFVMGVSLWWPSGAVNAAPEKADAAFCARLYSSKYYKPAASCYLKLAQSIPFGPKIKEADRLKKGRYLRESARNLLLLAKQESKPALAAYHRFQAVERLDQILKQKLVRKKFGRRRGRLIQVMREQAYKSIGYTPLAVSTANKKATIVVTGYKMKAQTTFKFNKSVRPGSYTIRVKYPKEQKARVKKVVVQQGKELVVPFIESPPLPALAWTGYIAGGVALIAGGVLLGVGLPILANANDCASTGGCVFVADGGDKFKICREGSTDPLCLAHFRCRIRPTPAGCDGVPTSPRNSDGKKNFDDEGWSYAIPGFIVLGVGAALIVTAIVVHVQMTQRTYLRQEKDSRTSALPGRSSRRAKVTLETTPLP